MIHLPENDIRIPKNRLLRSYLAQSSVVLAAYLANHNTRTDDEDPLRNFDFFVVINGFLSAYWQKVNLPKGTAEKIEYREGGENRTKRKFPGLIEWEDVQAERGVIVSRPGRNDASNWFKQTFDVGAKTPKATKDFRRTVEFGVFDREGAVAARHGLKQPWCFEYKPGGDYYSMGNGISMESIGITHEGLEELDPGEPPA